MGGGSLVYANQLLTPPDQVFAKPEWGPGDWKNRLAPHYQTARTMLGAVPCPRVGRADQLLAKIGEEIRGEDTFHLNQVGVYFGEPDQTVPDPYFNGQGPPRTGCTFCGACMIGCPKGAKNTLDKNYLYLARGPGRGDQGRDRSPGGWSRSRRATGSRSGNPLAWPTPEKA